MILNDQIRQLILRNKPNKRLTLLPQKCKDRHGRNRYHNGQQDIVLQNMDFVRISDSEKLLSIKDRKKKNSFIFSNNSLEFYDGDVFKNHSGINETCSSNRWFITENFDRISSSVKRGESGERADHLLCMNCRRSSQRSVSTASTDCIFGSIE